MKADNLISQPKEDISRLDIRLGYKCNNNCLFCCVGHKRDENISTEDVIKMLEFGKKEGLRKVTFTGGEPTIRKDLMLLIRHAKNLGYKEILVISNGRMCSYKKFFDQLVDAGLTHICFSLPHIAEKEYEHLTRVKGSFKQLMLALENAKKYDVRLSTITPINRLNYKDLIKITEFLIKLNKSYKRFFAEFMFINPEDNAWDNRFDLVPRISQVAPYVHKALDLAKKKRLELNVEAIPYCYMHGYEDKIVETFMAKKRFFIGPGQQCDFSYNETRRNEGKCKGPQCKACKYDLVCEGVHKNYVEIYGFDEFGLGNQRPKRKLLNAGSQCNQKCVFCIVDKFFKMESPDFKGKPASYGLPLNTNELKETIKESKCQRLMFIGGEPTLRPDLAELVEFAKKNNVKKVFVNTNGTNLDDERLVKELKSAGVDKLLISLHSHKRKTAERISRVKGSFDRTFKGIKNALKNKINVSLVHVIFEENYKDIVSFVDFVNSKLEGISSVNFVFIKPNDADVRKVADQVPRLTDVMPYLLRAFGLCNKNRIKFSIANVPICLTPGFENENLPFQEIIQRFNGDIDKWKQEKVLNKETDEYGCKAVSCKDCKWTNCCVGLIKEYADLYGTSELKPVKK